MTLTDANARYAILRTAFHGGGAASYHRSLTAAIRAERRETVTGCTCGCCGIVPITAEAAAELERYRDRYGDRPYAWLGDGPRPLLAAYPAHDSGLHYSQLSR